MTFAEYLTIMDRRAELGRYRFINNTLYLESKIVGHLDPTTDTLAVTGDLRLKVVSRMWRELYELEASTTARHA